ncbi:MAG TPA: hypothetical protein VI603_01015 [Saprospiraceae bacterium]|nr:hypothetical protein [Saprospiraceae bacterium]
MKTQALIVSADSEEDFKLLQKMLNKMGFPSVKLTEEEMEDFGLLTAMLKEPRGKYVTEKEIRRALKAK